MDQQIKFARHTGPELPRECSLNFSAAQRARQGPTDAPAITAAIKPIGPGVGSGRALAQLRCSGAARLAAAFLDLPTVLFHNAPIFISVESAIPYSAFIAAAQIAKARPEQTGGGTGVKLARCGSSFTGSGFGFARRDRCIFALINPATRSAGRSGAFSAG
jgi:hypothetical protein